MLNEIDLVNAVIDIAYGAGELILEVYSSNSPGTTYKADSSPVTIADIASNNYILKSLAKLTPKIQVISEENLNDQVINKLTKQQEVWLVDPLDGTKEFLKHNDEFAINIGLVTNGYPVLGVVYAPALDILYYGSEATGAWKKAGKQKPIKLNPETSHHNPKIIVSRSHLDKKTEEWLKKIGTYDLGGVGSSLKICYLAEGKADIYPHLHPIREWDTAAPDAILRLVGGQIIEKSSNQPVYNKPNLVQPSFIAFGPNIKPAEYLQHW
jgi:3'(2'), 5'-bisphosphate nucleotidase